MTTIKTKIETQPVRGTVQTSVELSDFEGHTDVRNKRTLRVTTDTVDGGSSHYSRVSVTGSDTLQVTTSDLRALADLLAAHVDALRASA